MIASVLMLSLGTFASPVIISEVRATREARHLRVEVEGDGGIDPEQAHAMIDDGRMFLYLGGTRVRADNRSWDLADGTGNVRAHRHRLQTELVIPLARNGCAGPVELAGSPRGITALVGCADDSAPVLEAAPARHAIPAEPRLAAPSTVSAPSAGAKHAVALAPAEHAESGRSKDADDKLKALVALPPERSQSAESPVDEESTTTPSPSGGGKTPVAPSSPKTSASGDEKPELPALAALGPKAPMLLAVAAAPNRTPLGTATPTPTPALSLAAPTPTPAQTTADTHSANIAAPTIGLVVLAGAAYWFARRRRAIAPRHIQIIETASLGPKRSLVVARIGEETLFLGTSEAGITLLKSTRDVPQVFEPGLVPESGLHETDIPISEALADIPQPTGIDVSPTPRAGLRTIEGGLASLFGRRRGVPAGSSLESVLPSDDLSFDDILEDSVEDQELRRKLAAGLSARAR